MLQVRLLGQFDVRVNGQRIVISSRAGQSLFAYLVLTAGTMHRREKLAGLFWPETSDDQARHSLRNELWRVRKAIQREPADAHDYLIADEYALGFNPDADYWLDTAILTAPIDNIDSLNATLSLYQGELLPGMYDDWVLLERERMLAVFETKMQALLTQLIQASRWRLVLEWAEKWIALGQTPEAAYRALMIAFAATHNHVQVTVVYERCRQDLKRELDIEPSDETRALYEQLTKPESARAPEETISLNQVLALPLHSSPPILYASKDEPPAPGNSPFKGLAYYDESDAALFFGREKLTEKLAASLRASNFLAVVIGASGSGKSSVVRAGLVSELKKTTDNGQQTTNHEWRITVITPTEYPLEALAIAFTRDAESVTATATLMDDMTRDARALYLFLKRMTGHRPPTTAGHHPPSLVRRHLLIVDQFEEIFTLCRDDLEREQFIDNLLYVVNCWQAHGGQAQGTAPTAPTLSLVLALRADFYAHLAQYSELRDLVAQHQEYIGPMNTEELRRAIEEPANKEGWEFEPGLVDLILRDVGDEPGALPLLSHALLETWKRRRGHRMTLKGYHDAGGVRGAIAQTAESAYQQLDATQQHFARNIFLRLTELGEGTEDTRRRATFNELVSQGQDGAAVRAVLNLLADARLITLSENTAEVAHEALIREWGRLREWLNQDRDGLRLHRQITQATREWELLERDAGALYRGARLAQAREWAEQNPAALNAQERAFLDVSEEQEKRETRERQEQRQHELIAAQKLAEEQKARADEQGRANKRLRRRALFLTTIGALAILLAGIALFFAKSANENAAAAFSAQALAQERLTLSEKQRLVAEGTVALEDKNAADVAALLAMHVLKQGYDQPADRLLLRALEHDYPRAIFFTNDSEGRAVDISPDGKYVLTGSNSAIAQEWEIATGKRTREFKTDISWTLLSVLYSPDGRRVITDANFLHLWDSATGKSLQVFSSIPESWSKAISADGKYIAGGTRAGTKIWELETGKLVQWLNTSPPFAVDVRFSPDGGKLLTVGEEGSAILWNVSTGKEIRRFVESVGPLHAAAISPDGKLAAAAGVDKKIWLWDIESGKLVRELNAHQASIKRLVFLPNSKYLVSSGDDASVLLWNIETGVPIRQVLGHQGPVRNLAVSRDGSTLATVGVDGKTLVWETFPQGEPLRIQDEGVWGAALSPDGKRFAISTRVNLRLYDAASGQKIGELDPATRTLNEGQIDTLILSPNGKSLFGRAPRGILTVGQIWDFATGEVRVVLQDQLISSKAAFSPNSKYVVTASQGTSYLWDTQTGTRLREFGGHPGAVGGVAFSPDGKYVATTSELDKTASLWETETGKEIRTFVGHTAGVEGIDFSPDGKQIVTGSQDQTLRIWDVESGKELRQWKVSAATVWNVKFSPDGKYILSGSDDRTARLWDTASGTQVREFSILGKLWTLGFFPDSKRIFVLGEDKIVRVWHIDLNDVINLACARLPRDLDAAELQEYGIRDYTPVCSKK